jgi:hypothetical protein
MKYFFQQSASETAWRYYAVNCFQAAICITTGGSKRRLVISLRQEKNSSSFEKRFSL